MLKLEKKKKAKKFAQLLNPSPQSNRDRSKPEVDNKLRVELGYPHAPGAVFSLGMIYTCVLSTNFTCSYT